MLIAWPQPLHSRRWVCEPFLPTLTGDLFTSCRLLFEAVRHVPSCVRRPRDVAVHIYERSKVTTSKPPWTTEHCKRGPVSLERPQCHGRYSAGLARRAYLPDRVAGNESAHWKYRSSVAMMVDCICQHQEDPGTPANIRCGRRVARYDGLLHHDFELCCRVQLSRVTP